MRDSFLSKKCLVPVTLFSCNAMAFLNKVVVNEDEEVYQGGGTGTSSREGGNEILKSDIFCDGWKAVLFFQR